MSRVSLFPNVASKDLLGLFATPEKWGSALNRLDILSLVQWAITKEPNPQAGPNNTAGFLGCVPRGAFRWLQKRGIRLSIEGGAVKEYSISDGGASCIAAMRETLSIIEENGGEVFQIVMDEPFTSGLAAPPHGCGWSVEKTAEAVARFVDASPGIKVGMVEAYPEHDSGQFARFLAALDAVGVWLPFLHVDIDHYRVKREQKPLSDDLRAIKTSVKARGSRFGAVVWGEHGTSNAAFCADASNLALAINDALDFKSQDDICFQSWSRTDQGQLLYPDNLPESLSISHTGFMLETLKRYGVPPKEGQ